MARPSIASCLLLAGVLAAPSGCSDGVNAAGAGGSPSTGSSASSTGAGAGGAGGSTSSTGSSGSMGGDPTSSAASSASSGGAGGSTTSASSTNASSSTGAGGCASASDCPGQDTPCKQRTCDQGMCGALNALAGTPAPPQVTGDCQKNQCDGAGHIVSVPSNLDLPDDGNPCTIDVCAAGSPVHTPEPAGTSCGAGLLCDAQAVCVGCLSASGCPGQDSFCQMRACTAGSCGFTFTAAGTPAAAQTSGDCHREQCNGAGSLVNAVDDTDLPNDGDPCTLDVCSIGFPSHPLAPAGSACGSGLACNPEGACSVACSAASDCPGQDTACAARACSGGACDVAYAAAGTPAPVQTPGDCHQSQCNGAGSLVSAIDDADLPDDSNPCTQDGCSSGQPTYTPLPVGSACGAGQACNGQATCAQACGLASDCPGQDGLCQTRTCTTGACGVAYAAAGTAVGPQIDGDCQVNACDGAGQVVSQLDVTDLPPDDGNECTLASCFTGVPTQTPRLPETSCAQNGGHVCDGAGNCVECYLDSDCPLYWQSLGNNCLFVSCSGLHTCNVFYVPPGTYQPVGPCVSWQCNGGQEALGPDFSTPQGDGTPCTLDTCAGYLPLPVGEPCSIFGTPNGTCDAQGQCAACVSPWNCPGQDTPCQARTCASGSCSVANAPAGTATPAQAPGDCHVSRCNGAGNTVNAVDDTDLPDDGDPCTLDGCSAGAPFHLPAPAGTACGNGLACDGSGACAGCATAADCPGQDDACETRTCAGGLCGHAHVAAGTPIAAQIAGDCLELRCDGQGGVASVVHDTDLPDDNNPCTADLCSGGAPSHVPAAAGTVCAPAVSGKCDGAGSCAPTFLVLEADNGGANPPGSATVTAILEERALASGQLLPRPGNPSSLNLWLSTVNGDPQGGHLALSADGHLATFGAYNTSLSLYPPLYSATALHREIFRVDAAGVVSVGATLDPAFDHGLIRSVASLDGSGYWASGTSSTGADGVWYVAGGGTKLLGAEGDPRALTVAGGRLWASAANGPAGDVFQIGAGLPTTGSQAAIALPGVGSTTSPGGLVLLDRDPAVPGVDTLYLADDRDPSSGGGIHKWTFDGAIWTAGPTLTGGLATGVRSLAGLTIGPSVTLLAVTTTASHNQVVSLVDDGSPSPAATVLVTAPPGAVYEGVCFAPR